MCVRLTRFWEVRGYLDEGERWASAALARSTGWPPRSQMLALRQATLLAMIRGAFERLESLSQRWLGVAQELGDHVAVGEASSFVGLYLWTQGALDRAVPLIEEGLTFWRMQKEREQADVATRRAEANAAGATLWDGAFLGGALTALGWVHLERVDLQQASAFFSMKTPPRPGRRRCRPRGVGAFGTRLPSARGRRSQGAARLARPALSAVHELGHKGSLRLCHQARCFYSRAAR